MTDRGEATMDDALLEVARAIRPYLPSLVGPEAQELDARIAELLAAAQVDPKRCDALRTLMNSREATAAFADMVLADAPAYRPPEWQPGYQRPQRRGGEGMQLPPGDTGPVLPAGRYGCPHGDYVWYRPAVGVPIPRCPTHAQVLERQ
jgi:hypothetical protein